MSRHFFFDLDGTLTDPGEGITKSVQFALRRYGINVEDRSLLRPFVGPPLVESFMLRYGFSPEQAQGALIAYREYFLKDGIFDNVPYPGIPEMLDALRSRGALLYVTSSKPLPFVETILDHFGFRKFFTQVYGATLDEKLVRKTDIIRMALSHCPDSTAANTLVIGDHHFDIAGAHANRLPACAVLYGYGNAAEIAAEAPEYTVSTVSQLHSCLDEFP